jgi:HlyD family secretion protein
MDNTAPKGPVSEATSARAAFDQLDALVRVTTVHGWIYLAALFAVGAGSIAFAVLYEVPTKVHGEGILLIEQDTLVQVRARVTGRLESLQVRPGDHVASGRSIGRVAEEELEDRIHESKARLAELERQDNELTGFEEAERQSKEAAIARVRETVLKAESDGLEKLKLARKVRDSADRLRVEMHLSDLELLESREKLYAVRDDLNKGRSRLAELTLDQVTAETARNRARLERRLRIRELTTRLKLDQDKLERTAPVVSPVEGRVAQVLSVPGGLVQEGAPVALLHAPKAERGADDAGPSYDAIVFVSAGEGKRIEVEHRVEVVPATVKREEHGFIRGKVVAISELPATKLAMEAALEHPELVDAFLKRYAPGVVLRVQIKLEEREAATPAGASGQSGRPPVFRWSSSFGPAQPLKTGTICQAAIIVERRPLIKLILPWTRRLVGADQ